MKLSSSRPKASAVVRWISAKPRPSFSAEPRKDGPRGSDAIHSMRIQPVPPLSGPSHWKTCGTRTVFAASPSRRSPWASAAKKPDGASSCPLKKYALRSVTNRNALPMLPPDTLEKSRRGPGSPIRFNAISAADFQQAGFNQIPSCFRILWRRPRQPASTSSYTSSKLPV